MEDLRLYFIGQHHNGFNAMNILGIVQVTRATPDLNIRHHFELPKAACGCYLFHIADGETGPCPSSYRTPLRISDPPVCASTLPGIVEWTESGEDGSPNNGCSITATLGYRYKQFKMS